MRALRETLHTLRSSPGFVVALLLTLAAAAFNGLMVGLMALRLDALLPGPFAEMGHFTVPSHRTHDLTFSFLFVPALVGVLAQFRRPSKNIAGMVMALIPSAALLLSLLLTVALANNARVLQPPWLTVMAGALIAVVLHPAGGGFLRSFAVSRVNRIMLALVIVAVIPLLVLAWSSIGLQRVGDDHAAAGHYGFMAAFAFTVLGVGVLASWRPDGWRVAAWVAGLLPALLGVTSLVYPDAASSLSVFWAVAAIAWGTAFVAVAEVTRDTPQAGPQRPSRRLTGSAGTPPTTAPAE